MPETATETPTAQGPEKPQTPKAPETKPAEKPTGQEQHIIERIDRDGDPRAVLSDLAGAVEKKPAPEGAVIDMVKGADGKWTTKDPNDPNFFYTPEPESPAVTPATPQYPPESSKPRKPEDIYAQWQAGEPQRMAQYQQFNQTTNEIWLKLQRQMASANPRVETRPISSRPPNLEARPRPNTPARPTASGQQENVSPKDRGEATEQQVQQREEQRQQELQNLQTEGTRLAVLVYTPEGQQQMAETRARLVQIVEATSRKPEMASGYDLSPAENAERIARNIQLKLAWQQTNEARVARLLNGDDLTNLEQRAYLAQALGREPTLTTDIDENKQRQALIAEFNKLRRDIGRALLYQSSDALPIEQRYLSTSEPRLRFYGISVAQAQESFAKGWDEIKIKVAIEQKPNHENEEPEKVDLST